MVEGMLIGFITVGFLMLVNIMIVSYTYGKLTQQVKDLDARVARLEKGSNSISK